MDEDWLIEECNRLELENKLIDNEMSQLKRDLDLGFEIVSSLLSEWHMPIPQGLDPTFYSTGSYEKDLEIQEKIMYFLGEIPND